MAKILLWLSVVITLATGYLAFATREKIDIVNKQLVTTREERTKLQGEKKQLIAEKTKLTEDLAAANKDIEEKKGQLAQAATDLTTSKAETAKAMEATEEVNKTLAATKDELDKLKLAMKPSDPNAAPVTPEQIADMKKQIDTLNAAVKEQTQVAESFKQREKESEEKVAGLNREIKRYRENIARPGISGRVVAVNQGWNFVVIDVGDRRGAAMSAPLIVTRGGQQIARLRITSVEPNSSIADVIPGSLPRGQFVQPGDTVIFSGRQPAAANQAPPADLPAAGAAPAGTAQAL